MAGKLALTNGNFKWIAKQLHQDLEPEVVMAFSKVECKREPFDKDGFPAILFERHVFYRSVVNSLGKKKANEWASQYPNLCYPKGYGRGGYGSYAGQRKKFSAAFALDSQCAMEACSWGAFQELGENYEQYGFEHVGEFVDCMKDGLYGQSIIFIKSMKARKLVLAMLNHRWAALAEGYNGSGYRQFKYDTQLKEAYDEAKEKNINWSRVKSEEPIRADSKPNIEDLEDNSDLVPAEHEPEATEEATNDQEPTEPKVAIEKPETENFLDSVKTEMGALTGGNLTFDGLIAKAQQAEILGLPYWFWYLAIGIVLSASLIYLIIRWKKHKSKEERDLELTNQLVKANSTSENKVVFFCKNEAEDMKARGYKLVWR